MNIFHLIRSIFLRKFYSIFFFSSFARAHTVHWTLHRMREEKSTTQIRFKAFYICVKDNREWNETCLDYLDREKEKENSNTAKSNKAKKVDVAIQKEEKNSYCFLIHTCTIMKKHDNVQCKWFCGVFASLYQVMLRYNCVIFASLHLKQKKLSRSELFRGKSEYCINIRIHTLTRAQSWR